MRRSRPGHWQTRSRNHGGRELGGSDPDLNARLYAALEAARKASVPRDTIERAVRKGAGQTGEKVIYELVTYEGSRRTKSRSSSSASRQPQPTALRFAISFAPVRSVRPAASVLLRRLGVCQPESNALRAARLNRASAQKRLVCGVAHAEASRRNRNA